MTDLEDRLRRDLTTLAERVQPQDIRGPQPLPRRRGRRAARWLAPVGAAVAVVVVATIGVLAGTGHVPRFGLATAVTTTTSPLAPTTAPAPGMPKFYAVIYNTFVGSKIPTVVAVRDSATGKTLTKVQVPTLYSNGGADGPRISAAADDRTYVITELGDGTNPSVWFFLLRVSADGRSATVRKLPITWPAGLSPDFEGAALSPDGNRLAIAVQACSRNSCHSSGVRVITIATGAVRTWTTTANGAPFQVTWAGNSRIAFEWQSSSKRPARQLRTAYRLLDVSGKSGDLLSGPVVATPRPVLTGSMPTALFTADGSREITTTFTSKPDGSGTRTVVARVVELNARTGQLLRVLAMTTVTGASTDPNDNTGSSAGMFEQGCDIIALAPHGTNLLASCGRFGRIGIHGFTPLPGSPGEVNGGAYAW
jgi:hypothetical protein